jgi:hypothetical protein
MWRRYCNTEKCSFSTLKAAMSAYMSNDLGRPASEVTVYLSPANWSALLGLLDRNDDRQVEWSQTLLRSIWWGCVHYAAHTRRVQVHLMRSPALAA